MAKSKYSTYTVPAIVVVHGDSERIVANHIKSALRLNFHIHSGKTSIQVTSLVRELKRHYPSVRKVVKEFTLNTTPDGKIKNFKIFTLMDTDDCEQESIKQSYLDGSIFNEYDLKEYVVPIYTSPDLEHVFHQCKLISHIFTDSEKVRGYTKAFPAQPTPQHLMQSKICELRELANTLRANNNTNFAEFIDYCIEVTEKRRVHN